MDIMMARVKPKVALSYRSVGSGSGGADFNSSSSGFGCGDVPVVRSVYNNVPMVHVPFLVGSVSVFHNVPGIGEGMRLDPCTLARIFRGDIATWDHPNITAQNPQLPDLGGLKNVSIGIVHRNAGSSSTYALTHYFNKTCPGEWTTSAAQRSVGTTTEWPADSPGRWTTVTNSQFMVEAIASNPYSLGYVESGQGLNAGLQEVAVVNANGTYLTSDVADIAPKQLIDDNFPVSDLSSAAWVNVNPVFASPGNPKQWPMTLGTYFYVQRDLTFLNQSGGLLLQFLSYMLSDDVATMMKDLFFTPLPASTRAAVLAGIAANVTLSATSGVAWRYEPRTNNTYGQQNYVFSNQRDSYLINTMAGLVVDNKDAKRTLMLGDAYQVHGSGSFVSAVMVRQTMHAMQSQARVPVSMTYRAVGSVEAQAEFVDYENMYASYNHFKVADLPLASAEYTTLTTPPASNTTGAVLQLPFAISALGLYYNKALPGSALVLNCSLIARLYTGDLAAWNDKELVSLNNFTASAGQTLLNYTLVVYGMAAPSGPTWALTGYLAASCGSKWTSGQQLNVTWPSAVRTSYNNAPIRTPDDMLAAIAGTPNAIGYAPAPAGAASGLAEAALLVGGAATLAAQANLTKVVTQAQASNPSLFTSATADLSAAVGGLYGQDGTWPIPMVQYLYMFRDLRGYGYSGPLLRAFAEYLCGDPGAALATAAGLTPMPPAVRKTMRSAIDTVLLKTLTVVWSVEEEGSYDSTGSGLYTFSANRQSYDAYALAALQSDINAVNSRLDATTSIALRLACSPSSYPLTRLLRADLQDMASTPLRVLDETVPSVSTIAALTSTISGASAPTHAIINSGPLLSEQWASLARSMAIVQVPAAIRPIALLYKGPAGLRLSPCTVAGILKGDIRAWDHSNIKNDNPGLLLPSNQLTLLQSGPTDADALALAQWVRVAAPASSCAASDGLLPPADGALPNEQLVSKLAADASYKGLAIVASAGLASSEASGAGLQAVALPSLVSGTYVTPLQTGALRDTASCPDSGCSGAVAQAYTAAVDEIVGAATGLGQLGAPGDALGDWSNFTLLPANGPKASTDVYPVFRLDFYVAPADLSRFGVAAPAARAIIQYGASSGATDRVNSALGPYFAGMGPVARSQLVERGVSALQVPATVAAWSIVSTSGTQATNPAGTIVLGRAPALRYSSLPGSDAAASWGSWGSVGRGDVQVMVEQQVEQATQWLRDQEDKLTLAYNIGVAALVLALVLSLTALILGAYAVAVLRKQNSGGSGGGGGGGAAGCFTPAATKYEPHVDAPAGPHVEMQMRPNEGTQV